MIGGLKVKEALGDDRREREAGEDDSAGDQEVGGQATAIKGKAPEARFVPGYYTEVGLIAPKSREVDHKVPLVGGDGWDSAQLIGIGGSALNGCYYSNHWAN